MEKRSDLLQLDTTTSATSSSSTTTTATTNTTRKVRILVLRMVACEVSWETKIPVPIPSLQTLLVEAFGKIF